MSATGGAPARAQQTLTSATNAEGGALTENSRGDTLNKILRGQAYSGAQDNRFRVRKNAQQALLYLSPIIALKNERFYTREDNETNARSGPLMKTDSWEAALPTPDENLTGWRSGYRNIVPITSGLRKGPTVLSGKNHPDISVTQLTGQSKLINRFFTFEITAEQQAYLVPKIQIFKLDYILEKKGGKVNRKKPPTRRPIRFGEAIEVDKLDPFGALETDGDIWRLINEGGNLGGNGIENFTWDLKGVNPAEVDSNIEATLKVYFNNINAFNDSIAAIYSSTTTRQTDGSFIDLITFASPQTPSKNLPCLEHYDPYFFEIEVRVGWNVMANVDDDILNTAQIEFIESQEVYLYLTLTDHKFDFKEDGSASLEVNYRARSTMNARAHDILEPPSNLQSELDDLEVKRSAIEGTDEVSSVDAALIEDQEKKVAKALKTNYTRIIENILLQAYQAEIPNALLLNNMRTTSTTTISTAGTTPATGDTGLSYSEAALARKVTAGVVRTTAGSITVDQFFQIAGSSGDKTRSDTETFVEGALRPLQAALDDVDLSATNMTNAARMGQIKVNRRTFSSGDTADLVKLVTDDDADNAATGDKANAAWANRGEEISAPGPGFSMINFFYLGDILEVLLQTPSVVALFKQKKFAIVTTDFRFKNYFKLIKNMSVFYGGSGAGELVFGGIPISDLKCKEATLSKRAKKDFYSAINMANIPINMEIFLDFFAKKVVSSDRQTYYLEDLLNDIFNSLVKPMLGEPGILGVPVQQPVMINVTVDTSNQPGVGSLLWNTGKQGVSGNRGDLTGAGSYLITDAIGSGDDWLSQFNYINPVSKYTSRSISTAALGYSAGYPGAAADLTMKAFPPKPKKEEHIAAVKILGILLQCENLDGNYDTNLTYGINNFLIGLDRGIVKAASFERVDQPYLREARTATSKNFGLGQLRELYNVKLTLFGNNLLRPGQIIYVEPNGLIFGRPVSERSAARILGLGGYHLVVDVSNEISKDGWETKVKALHMAMPLVPGN